MPILGFGTYQLPQGPVAEKSIEIAFRTGYRHLDTAAFYHNEESVGKAVRNSSINRKDIFVTTKLWNSDQGFEQTKKAFDLSLKKLDIEYIDLYLIHWPVEGLRKDSWRALEEIYEEGLCKAIGVSNYTIRHLEGTQYPKILIVCKDSIVLMSGRSEVRIGSCSVSVSSPLNLPK